MGTTLSEDVRVLRFWRDLEIFNIPASPSSRDTNAQTTISTLRHGNRLPWTLPAFEPTDTHGYVHVVYLGVADTEDLARLLLQGLFPAEDLTERERQRVKGNGWLAAFVVNEAGYPIPESYLPASFVHGVAALRETNALENVNGRLARAKEEFSQRQLRMSVAPDADNVDTPGESIELRVVDWEMLGHELSIVQQLLGATADDKRLDWRLVVRTSRVKRKNIEDSLKAATDFLNSFYLDDLDRLIVLAEKGSLAGKAVSAYLGPTLSEPRRIDILNDASAMSALVSAARLPSARWPASPKHPLVLAQQAVVSEVAHSLGDDGGLIGVNGPPGTGKTTLLCDVIAEIVCTRARRLATLGQPGDLFEAATSVAGRNFFPLKSEVVAGTSIVVTSTNNNAVKNISQELPALAKLADDFNGADYFADVMREVFRQQKVFDEEKQPVAAWGVIAAALGNAGNRRSFSQGFFRDEFKPKPGVTVPDAQAVVQEEGAGLTDDDGEREGQGDERPASIKQILEDAYREYARYQREWHQARDGFLTMQKEFDALRQVLMRAEQAAQRIDAERQRLDALTSRQRSLDDDVDVAGRAFDQLRSAQATQLAVVEANRAVLESLRSGTPPTLWDRLMGWFGKETSRMADLRRSLVEPTRELAESSAALAKMSKEIALAEAQLGDLKSQADRISSEIAQLTRILESHRRELEKGRALGVTHFPDADFWALPADVRHRASVAVFPKLDELRAKLFLGAVELHRLTVLANAGKFIGNLRAVNGMLTGASRDKLSPEDRPRLWDAFFFVVPVVSTTLASFDRLFVGMGQESLGWLLIDEAGQATPQSAVGAIWRSQRAVIVGDPLQIEPVFTVPRNVVEDLRRRHDVAPRWSPIDESVQTLADRITPYGSWVDLKKEKGGATAPQALWTGMPLRTHRRCDDPMFTVANRIAYAGQMVQGRVDAEGRPMPSGFRCNIGESAWIDVRSQTVSHPVSQDEIACLMQALVRLREDDAKTKVYVISPFRKVAETCKARVRAAGLEGIECGTVHTFQGKEARIVFLVLGTAPGQEGAGARNWASSKPNLLNVAITRAQNCLYVIGDVSQWGGLNYFRELLDLLPVTNSESGRLGADALSGVA